jgi:polyphosphate kinase 2 (PPK2 family)
MQKLRVAPGTHVDLARDYDPRFKAGSARKRDGEELLTLGVEMLSEYQERLAAEGARGLLVILQGIDAAGKDGTIRHVMSGVNPQGVTVHSFKVPSDEELRHDFLWRYGRAAPGPPGGSRA